MKSLLTIRQLTWKKTILFAVLAGVYTGVVAMIPALEDTSFRDISISFEWWIFFGILIILNSTSNLDSALKCFAFFLISQPLVYLVQVPFNPLGFALFQYYRNWLVWTFLTLPMGYVGYWMKRDDLPGLLILSPMLLFLGLHIHTFLGEVVSFFPNHLLSLLFCIASLFLYVNGIFSGKRERQLGNRFCALILAVCLYLSLGAGSKSYETTLKYSDEELPFDETYRVCLGDESYGHVSIEKELLDGEEVYCIRAAFTRTGETTMILENDTVQHEFTLDIGRSTYVLREKP